MGAEQRFSSVFGSFELNIAGYTLAPTYLQAGLILFLLFLLVLVLARVRRHFIDWSLKGSVVGIFLGFALALILEGFLLIAGRTAITEILGWKNAPKPIQTALDSGREKLSSVLGETQEVPPTLAEEGFSSQDVVSAFESLDSSEAGEVRLQICSPER
ncbi:MAG: hypothetical protein UV56_C0013G0008 [Candidatus Woesebacteria bacterium GW2011_GWC1_43_10b]|uniref:Uncharacterized protein n=2 Tax=Candidatus Woeseibacteriota TaxID=1752722 RepID=A0A0G1GDQ4_9BACT|nr:MAG: hypothetical protein UV56_C0013G0008 [Candidatus Woesebacteria bacterium GW2011_GWC1_43_10b]KKT33026.1 MAG: hypothetical protein UW21_C0015G0007 [Candidatus Woesebacteria bacterium GW2011_GWB1_44_11b]